MKHWGVLNSMQDPLVPGGLTAQHIADLKAKGWKEGVTTHEIKDAIVGFADASVPGSVTLRKVDIKAGERFLGNEDKGSFIVLSCGNGGLW